jgi:hypothetical protein
MLREKQIYFSQFAFNLEILNFVCYIIAIIVEATKLKTTYYGIYSKINSG